MAQDDTQPACPRSKCSHPPRVRGRQAVLSSQARPRFRRHGEGQSEALSVARTGGRVGPNGQTPGPPQLHEAPPGWAAGELEAGTPRPTLGAAGQGQRVTQPGDLHRKVTSCLPSAQGTGLTWVRPTPASLPKAVYVLRSPPLPGGEEEGHSPPNARPAPADGQGSVRHSTGKATVGLSPRRPGWARQCPE